jgi:hypothetical protein
MLAEYAFTFSDMNAGILTILSSNPLQFCFRKSIQDKIALNVLCPTANKAGNLVV